MEFLLVEITLLNRVILVGSVYYRPHNCSVFYRALEGVCSDLLSLYGEVFILGDFNVGVLDPDHVLFAPFSDLLETFRLQNFAILPTRRVSGKILHCYCWCE
jgi:hypothetical protein